MSNTTIPRIGVGVFVLQSSQSSDDVKFIMGKRMGSVGAGTWALPGGHLEFGETFEECAKREVYEETGLVIRNCRFLTATNDVMETEKKHYVTIFMVCERTDDKEPTLEEPEKCEGWEWVSWKQLQDWTEAQTSRLKGRVEETKFVNGASVAPELFSPLVALAQQRPHVKPSLI